MYAYCGSNPILNSDPAGTRHEISAGGVGCRDVTKEIMDSLHEECRQIKKFKSMARGVAAATAPFDATARSSIVTAASCVDFYLKVNHQAPWDIKRKDPWRKTIGTPYPGAESTVSFDGMLMTPEMLGNFTYGYLGCKYGFSLPLLYAGSYYAAGFPTDGSDLDNELWDWGWITKGYSYALLGN